ncbi:ABC transporter ATP-binding protein [Planococcus sp. 107-1]|uniref:ABC transporter ATP-binding protein n=1 Tax=Planococcus sp. 107-1 TaxID=2908840 RepID=UPI001F25D529|nr:ATP-binding cassette domain-containing protein [Planococcus sp. 107-1]UJF26427.1 ATP-binding cassette domain-containing protein [Planococcus sp. 107-1]
MNQLRITQLEKKFGERKKEENPAFSLKPVHLTIEEGEFFSLLGPSGCGKTTLLKLLAGLEQADNGEVWVGEANITNVPSEARNFAMVFQQPLLFPHMNVEDNIAFGLKMKRVKRAERIERALEMLGHVGLKGYGKRFPNELSGGQQQRAALARALVSDRASY